MEVFLEPFSDNNLQIIEELKKEKIEKGEEVKEGEEIPLYTFSRGDRMYVTSHFQNFIDCVRSREKPRCNEDDAFEEAVTLVMSVIAYQERRMVTWDHVKQDIV